MAGTVARLLSLAVQNFSLDFRLYSKPLSKEMRTNAGFLVILLKFSAGLSLARQLH